MSSLERCLLRRDDGLALLFTPPSDKGSLDLVYIKRYPPGLRENGGQFGHAAVRPHIGRGGWTWYTGAAGWTYRAPGSRASWASGAREDSWSLPRPPHSALVVGFKAPVDAASTRYEISVETPWHCAAVSRRRGLGGVGMP
jgi:cyclic beta-1,2-glucan synthetase